MKRFEITYNPYSNRMHFRVAEPIDEDHVSPWREMLPESSFVEYQNKKCIFENCSERIINLVNNYINTTDSLEILFNGTIEDFEVLQATVRTCSDIKAKRIKCIHNDVYPSSNTVLDGLSKVFAITENEFADCINSNETNEEEIKNLVVDYENTVKPEISICVIGPYGVGKTALINSFIGRDILPDKSYYSISVRNDDEYRLEFNYHKETYEIVVEGTIFSVVEPADPDEQIISLLFSGCDVCGNEQELVHFALVRLNDAHIQ